MGNQRARICPAGVSAHFENSRNKSYESLQIDHLTAEMAGRNGLQSRGRGAGGTTTTEEPTQERQRMLMPMPLMVMERSRMTGTRIPDNRSVVPEGAAGAVAPVTAEATMTTAGTMMTMAAADHRETDPLPPMAAAHDRRRRTIAIPTDVTIDRTTTTTVPTIPNREIMAANVS